MTPIAITVSPCISGDRKHEGVTRIDEIHPVVSTLSITPTSLYPSITSIFTDPGLRDHDRRSLVPYPALGHAGDDLDHPVVSNDMTDLTVMTIRFAGLLDIPTMVHDPVITVRETWTSRPYTTTPRPQEQSGHFDLVAARQHSAAGPSRITTELIGLSCVRAVRLSSYPTETRGRSSGTNTSPSYNRGRHIGTHRR